MDDRQGHKSAGGRTDSMVTRSHMTREVRTLTERPPSRLGLVKNKIAMHPIDSARVSLTTHSYTRHVPAKDHEQPADHQHSDRHKPEPFSTHDHRSSLSRTPLERRRTRRNLVSLLHRDRHLLQESPAQTARDNARSLDHSPR